MSSPLQRVYNSLNKPRAGISPEGVIFVKGKGTYHKRNKLKELGGRWVADGKYWAVPSIEVALKAGALFWVRARVEAHCHMPERVVNMTHEEALSGVNRMGCPMCDCSFKCGDDVKVLEIEEGSQELLDSIQELLAEARHG